MSSKLSRHGAEVIVNGGVVGDAGQLGVKVSQTGSADLENLATVTSQPANITGNLSEDNLLRHGAPPAINAMIIMYH